MGKGTGRLLENQVACLGNDTRYDDEPRGGSTVEKQRHFEAGKHNLEGLP